MSSDQKPESWGFGVTIMVIVGLIALISFGAFKLAGSARTHYDRLVIEKAAAEVKAKAAAAIESKRISVLAELEDLGPMPTPEDIAAGKLSYNSCLACHGPNAAGLPAPVAMALGGAPNLAGMPIWYSQLQISKIKDGIRGHKNHNPQLGAMKAMVSILDDKKIFQVAGYMQSLEKVKPQHSLSGDAQKGKALFASCVACHREKGEGNPSRGVRAAPLNNLPDWYIVKQLKEFKAGLRGTHPKDKGGAAMQAQAVSIKTEQDMIDIAEYIKTLDK
jgi:cbb3-type cytochrome c oxidase subunit III